MKKIFVALFATRENRKFVLWGIAVLFFVLIAIIVMATPPDDSIFMYIAGEKAKLEIIKLIGWVISGLIAIFGVVGLFKRAAALDKQNEMTEKSHIHERFKTATEHLGNERVSVRIAAFNEFYHLAEIEPDLQKTIFDILCAHLRQTTKDKNYQPDERGSEKEGNKEIKPTEEVQSLLNILFKLNNKDSFIFRDMNADLGGANLRGANLQESNLQEVNLRGANLQESNLQDAELQESNLQDANLQDANLEKANLRKANLINADLTKAILSGANLQKAEMQLVDLGYAQMQGTNLQEAILDEAFLQTARLREANMHGASLFGAMISKNTTMPDDWRSIVKIDEDGKTGVLLVNDKGNVIAYL